MTECDPPARAAAASVSALRSPEQVVSDIGSTILQEGLRAGDELPDDTQLARSLGVSRARLRQGLETLHTLGVIETQADGSHIAGGGGTSAMSTLVSLRMSLAGFTTADLVDVRVQLETCAARRAALEATPATLAHMHDLVRAMREPGVGRQRFQHLDDQFHNHLAEASNNTLTTELMQALRDAVTTKRTAAFTPIIDWAQTKGRLIDEHQHIVTALENGAGPQAAEHISHHIQKFYAAAR